jgi:hypothetical protein
MNRIWTDEDLYKRYGITSSQTAFIKSLISDRPSNDSSDSTGDDDE